MAIPDTTLTIKAHTADAIRGIAGVKLALAGLRREQVLSTGRQKQITKENQALTQSLNRQSRSLRGLTLQWSQLRRMMLTFTVRSAILGITALTAAVNSLATTAGIAVISLSNLGAASVIGGLQGLASFGQAIGVLSFGMKDLAKAYTTFGTIHGTVMKKLTKPAREFYKQTKDIRNGIKELKVLSQEGMFPGLLKAFDHLRVLGPIVAQTVYDTATSLGYLADKAAIVAEKRAPALERILNRNVLTIQRMGDGAINFGAAVITAWDHAGPLLDHMSGAILKFSGNVRSSFRTWAKDGQLDKFFQTLRKSWDNWTAILGSTLEGLFNFWKALQPVTHKVENAIEGAAKKFDAWTKKAENQDKIRKFFSDSLKPMGAFLQLVGDIAGVWADFAKKGNDDAVRLFNGIDTKVLPILQELGDYFDGTLLPRVADLTGAFLDLVRTALPSIKSLLTVLQPVASIIEDVLTMAADLIDALQDLGDTTGAIGTLAVGAAIISSWHKLRTAISLTLLTMRASAGSPGAVMPKARAFQQVIPGLGFTRGARSFVRGARRYPAHVGDVYGEAKDRGLSRKNVGRSALAAAVLGGPEEGLLQRAANSGMSPGGVILPPSAQRSMETSIAKTARGGFLRGLKGVASGLAATGMPQAIGLSIALIAGPAIVSELDKALRDHRPQALQKIGRLGGDERSLLPGRGGGRLKIGLQDESLRQANDELAELVRLGDSQGIRDVADNLNSYAKAVDNISKKHGIKDAAKDVHALAVATDTALLQKVIPDFDEFAKQGTGHVNQIRDRLAVLQNQIGNKIPNDDAPAFRDAMASSFGAAAQAVKDSMHAGLISIKRGTRMYKQLLGAQFKELGFTPQQVKNLVATGGVDPTGKKGGSENPGGVNIVNNPGTGSGSFPGPHAIGGGFYIGNKGERGRDSVPMNIAGQSIVAGRGEYVGIFNAQQQKAFSQMAATHGYNGMEGFFSANNRPHYMASGGLVSLGNRLQGMGYEVSEHPNFGGVHPVHVKNSLHYSGNALDINDDFPPFGPGGGEPGSLDRLAAMLKSKGWHYLWRIKDHFDHLHVDTGSGSHGIVGAIAQQLGRVGLGGSGMLKGLAQGVLDRYRQGANSLLGMLGGGAAAEGEQGIPSGGGGGAAANMKLAQQMMYSFGWGQGEWPALRSLGMGESGWITDRTNTSSGAFGIGQFLGGTGKAYAKYGALSHGNSAGQINAMLHYIQDRYGSPTKAYSTWLSRNPHWYYAGGLLAPPIGQGYPDVDPGDANTIADQEAAKKKKKKKHHKTAKPPYHHIAGGRPAVGAGYTRHDFAGKLKHKLKPRKRVRALINRIKGQGAGFARDPLTGEVTNGYQTGFDNFQHVIDSFGGDLSILESKYNSAEDLQEGSGFQYLDDMLGIHESKPFMGGKGHGILGALTFQETILDAINAKPAISKRRTELAKVKKFVLSNIKLREKYGKKLRKMKTGVGWKGAVGHNDDIIRQWQRWKRDSVGETPAQTRQANHEIDRLQDENRWLKDHKPKRLSTTTAAFTGAVRAYNQRGVENKALTGDADIHGWYPSQFTEGSAAGRLLSQLQFWGEAQDIKSGNLDQVKLAIQDEKGEIGRLRKQMGAGPAGKADTSARDELLKTIGENALRDKFRSGLDFSVLAGFAQMLGTRSIGAFAHGGPIRESGMALLHRGEYVLPSPDGPFRQGMNAPVNVNATPNITLILKDRAGALIELVDARIDGRSASVANRQVGRSARQLSLAPGRAR